MNGNISPASLSAPWYNSLLEGIDRLLGRPTAPSYDPQVVYPHGAEDYFDISPPLLRDLSPQELDQWHRQNQMLQPSVTPSPYLQVQLSPGQPVFVTPDPVKPEPFWYHEQGLVKGAGVTPAATPDNWQDHYREQDYELVSTGRDRYV